MAFYSFFSSLSGKPPHLKRGLKHHLQNIPLCFNFIPSKQLNTALETTLKNPQFHFPVFENSFRVDWAVFGCTGGDCLHVLPVMNGTASFCKGFPLGQGSVSQNIISRERVMRRQFFFCCCCRCSVKAKEGVNETVECGDS